MSKYWKTESPVIIRTSHNVFRWFKNAGKFHVSKPDYVDEHGIERPGKTVSWDTNVLTDMDDVSYENIREFLIKVLDDLKRERG
jgi:hypothetical protein